MVCPNCGTQLPEGAGFCTGCGARLSSIPTAPAGTLQKKRAYLLKSTDPKTKLSVRITLGIGVLCLLLLVLAANTVVNGSMLKIPLLNMALGDRIDELDDTIDDVLDKLDDASDEELEELEEKAGYSLATIKSKLKNPSLNNFQKLGTALQDEAGIDNEDLEVFGIVITFVWIYALILLLIAALAVLFVKPGLAILTLILSLPFHIFLSGVLHLILGVVSLIALTVMLSKLNRTYKAYKNSFIGA